MLTESTRKGTNQSPDLISSVSVKEFDKMPYVGRVISNRELSKHSSGNSERDGSSKRGSTKPNMVKVTSKFK